MKTFAYPLRWSLLALTLLPVFARAVAYSDPLGIIRVDLKGGGQTNVFSSPFLPQAVFQTEVASVTGVDITMAATVDSSYAGTHYLEVVSGSGVGSVTDIVSVTGAVVETADDWSAVVTTGDAVVVREIPTLESIFGADNKFGFKARTPTSDPDDWDLIYVFDPQFQTLLQAYYVDFPTFQGWVDLVSLSPLNPKIYPETALLALVKGSDVSLTMVGEVSQTAPKVAVFPGLNFVSVFNPLSDVAGVDPSRVITLGTSGLYTGDPATGIIPRDNIIRHDVIMLPSQFVEGAYDFYFYHEPTSSWYNDIDFSLANDRVIETGTAVIVLRYMPGASEFAWPQPNLHLAAP